MFKLVISDDEGQTTVVPLVRDEVSIGRAEGNTIRLTDRNVSRHHAVLRRRDGKLTIEDLDSYNGTLVNGAKVGEAMSLSPGDEVHMGDYKIALHVDSSEVTDESTGARAATSEDAGPPARLVMLTLPVPGAEFALAGDHMRIGRSDDLEIWINHQSISREHAEIYRDEEGCLRIADLGSANGVRVNGDEVEESDLEPYDVIKLGRVRLRYVPAGEAYIFDPAAESGDEDDATEGDGSGSRAPLWMAAGIVVVAALVGGGIVVYSGMPAEGADDPAEAPAGLDAPPAELPGADPAEDEPAPTPEEALAACKEALKEGRWQEAVTHAEAALGVRPDDTEAADCRTAGRSGVAFHRGHDALEAGDLEEAYAAFAQIPEDNPFRQHPSITEATERLADARLDRAREALGDDLGQARELVADVLDMDDAPPAARRQALKLKRAIEARDRRGKRSTGAGGGGGAPGDGAAAGSGPSPFDKALACARDGDNACVVQALEGRTGTARGLALLIETYRTMGETQAAVRNMRLFVQRFPSDRRAARYQQFLDNQQ
jgi:ABC transport system ATP-binding/permease protein